MFVCIVVLKGQHQRWRKCHVSSVKPCSIWCRSVLGRLLSGLGRSQATVINHKQRGPRGDRLAKGADGLTQLGALNPLEFQDLAGRRDYLHNLIFRGTRKHLCLISQSFHWLFRRDLLLCASPCCFQFWYLSLHVINIFSLDFEVNSLLNPLRVHSFSWQHKSLFPWATPKFHSTDGRAGHYMGAVTNKLIKLCLCRTFHSTKCLARLNKIPQITMNRKNLIDKLEKTTSKYGKQAKVHPLCWKDAYPLKNTQQAVFFYPRSVK